MLHTDETVVVVIDVQEKLAAAITEAGIASEALCRLLRGARVLSLPVIMVEQYPEKLGPTRADVAAAAGVRPLRKTCFDACDCEAFVAALEATGRRHVVIAGMEAHVCVYQTVMSLLAGGFNVYVTADAVASRKTQNRDVALRRMESEGARLCCAEMVLFEMLSEASGPQFKGVLAAVK